VSGDIKALKKAAERVKDVIGEPEVYKPRGEHVWEVGDGTGFQKVADTWSRQTAVYFALANPTTILALLADLAEAHAAIDEALVIAHDPDAIPQDIGTDMADHLAAYREEYPDAE
jgi:hypothetical protein